MYMRETEIEGNNEKQLKDNSQDMKKRERESKGKSVRQTRV